MWHSLKENNLSLLSISVNGGINFPGSATLMGVFKGCFQVQTPNESAHLNTHTLREPRKIRVPQIWVHCFRWSPKRGCMLTSWPKIFNAANDDHTERFGLFGHTLRTFWTCFTDWVGLLFSFFSYVSLWCWLSVPGVSSGECPTAWPLRPAGDWLRALLQDLDVLWTQPHQPRRSDAGPASWSDDHVRSLRHLQGQLRLSSQASTRWGVGGVMTFWILGWSSQEILIFQGQLHTQLLNQDPRHPWFSNQDPRHSQFLNQMDAPDFHYDRVHSNYQCAEYSFCFGLYSVL